LIRIKPRLWHLTALVAYLAGIFAVVRARFPDETARHKWLPLALILALIPPHLAGPVRATMQFSRRGELFAGEILWAWLGITWMLLLVGTDGFLKLAIVTALLAIGLAIFGLRPPARGMAWAHQVGWALLVIDIALCGWVVMAFPDL
jgi:hypothetical protein